MDFGYVPPPVPRWLRDACDPIIERALRDDDMSDVWADVRTGIAQLWVARDARAVRSAVVTRSGEGNCEVWLMAGCLADVPFLATIEEAARADGMVSMSLTGRAGWARVLKHDGWRITGADGDLLTLGKVLR